METRKRKRDKGEVSILERLMFSTPQVKKTCKKMAVNLDVDSFHFDCKEKSSNEGCGSINLGNSCYMNAILQSMSTSKNFVSKLRNSLIDKQDDVMKWNALQQRAYKQAVLFCQALVLMNADDKIELDLTGLKEILPLPFQLSTQEDPYEFLGMMFDVIQNVLLDFATTGDLYNHPFAATPMKDFLFPVIQETSCDSCGYCVRRHTQEAFVEIPFVSGYGIESLFMLRNETVKVENVHCDNCAPEPITNEEIEQIKSKTKPDKRVSKTKKTTEPDHDKIPIEFIFVLMCFDGLKAKKSGNIRLEQRSTFSGVQCELVSVVVHAGTSSNSGHYFTFRLLDDQWRICDDHRVRKVSFEVLGSIVNNKNCTPYLLHYKRVDYQERNVILVRELKMAQETLKTNRIYAKKIQEDDDNKSPSGLQLSMPNRALHTVESSEEDEVDIVRVQEDDTIEAQVHISPSLKYAFSEKLEKEGPSTREIALTKKTLKAEPYSYKNLERNRLVKCSVCEKHCQRQRIKRHYSRDKMNDKAHQERLALVEKALKDKGAKRRRKNLSKVVATEALFSELNTLPQNTSVRSNPFQMAARKKKTAPDQKKDTVMAVASKPNNKKQMPPFLKTILENDAHAAENAVNSNEMIQALNFKFAETMTR